MNIIIEDAEALEFCTGDGQWSKNAAEGKRYAGTAQYESLQRDSDGPKLNMLTATTAVKILSPDDMVRVKWWLEEWFLEWKGLANIRNDTNFLARSKTSKLKLGSDEMIKSL